MSNKIVAALAAATVLLTSTGALAHAAIANSTIANNGSVAASPGTFDVTFSAPVRLASVTLTNGAGQRVNLTYRPPSVQSATFAVPLPRLANGTYTLSFSAMGADGHAMTPQTRFSVGSVPAVAAANAAPAPSSTMGSMDHSKMGGMAGMDHSKMGNGGPVVTTSIADGAVLMTAPTSMRVQFPHPMRLTAARLTVASGETIPVRMPTSTIPTDAADITFPRLDADSYILTWGANAGDHAMSGTVRFRVR